MDPILRLEGLSKSFGGVKAVEDVSFDVFPGEVVGLLGPNGAGKTTTLRMLAGLLAPSKGRVLIAGTDMSVAPIEAKAKLGFMTASTGLYERLTAREVLETFGRLYGLNLQSLAHRMDEVCKEFSLENLLDKRCSSLSSGQKQRLSVARAVIHDPLAYVLDEPTSTLDPLAASSILKTIQNARARKKAVLFSTHRMEEAEYLCDRLIFLREGRVVARGTPEELRQASGKNTLTGIFLNFAQSGANP